jgi:hypothetical protein
MERRYPMKNKIFLLLMLAGFLLSAQSAGAFDAGNWFTGRAAAAEKTLAGSQRPARSSSRESRPTSLKQLMYHIKEKNHSKKHHSRR